MIASAPAGTAHAAPANPFFRRRAVIVTKHGKERVLYPTLRNELGAFPEVLLLDTDRFGTFTGEIARTGSQLDALRAKLRAAIEATPYDALIVASEGSFFPDPAFPQVTIDRECVAIFDPQSGIEIVGSAIAGAQHVGSFQPRDERALEDALQQCGAPSHAVVVHDGEKLHKGLRERGAIHAVARAAWSRGLAVRVESDLRAHVNPTRLGVIAQACEDAVRRARSCCPSCSRPGFWVRESIAGLPCQECAEPTNEARAYRWTCEGCGLYEERAAEKRVAAPGSCTWCNP